MITRISFSQMNSSSVHSVKNSPAFGLAKLNEKGRETADSFGYTTNEYLNENLFKKQGFFSKSALVQELNNGSDFTTLCNDYGCTKNGKANAEFIRTQILAKKSQATIQSLDPDTRSSALISLFKANYDNPELSVRETDDLLDMVKDNIPNTEYAQYAGLIKIGTDKF